MAAEASTASAAGPSAKQRSLPSHQRGGHHLEGTGDCSSRSKRKPLLDDPPEPGVGVDRRRCWKNFHGPCTRPVGKPAHRDRPPDLLDPGHTVGRGVPAVGAAFTAPTEAP